jgi:hypothetical protein
MAARCRGTAERRRIGRRTRARHKRYAAASNRRAKRTCDLQVHSAQRSRISRDIRHATCPSGDRLQLQARPRSALPSCRPLHRSPPCRRPSTGRSMPGGRLSRPLRRPQPRSLPAPRRSRRECHNRLSRRRGLLRHPCERRCPGPPRRVRSMLPRSTHLRRRPAPRR